MCFLFIKKSLSFNKKIKVKWFKKKINKVFKMTRQCFKYTFPTNITIFYYLLKTMYEF